MCGSYYSIDILLSSDLEFETFMYKNYISATSPIPRNDYRCGRFCTTSSLLERIVSTEISFVS